MDVLVCLVPVVTLPSTHCTLAHLFLILGSMYKNIIVFIFQGLLLPKIFVQMVRVNQPKVN